MGGVHPAATGPPALTVRVLGRFRIESGYRSIELPTQAQRVIGYLAVTGTCERRCRLAGRLWPFSPQRRADANLRTALWRIGSVEPQLVEATRSVVALGTDVKVDLREATAAATSLIAGAPRELPDLTRLWPDDLLPGWDEDWLLIERERARQIRIHGLESLSRNHLRDGRFSEAIDAALTAIAAEPLRESAHAALIDAHLAEGNVGEARRQLMALTDILGRELGITPSESLIARVQRVDCAVR